MHACTQENSDANLLSQLVVRDPVLTVELLRITNSAYFGFAEGITSVAHAVTIIGQHALRNMALCIAMKEAFGHEQLPAFPVAEFWEDALRRGVCARQLSELTSIDGDTSFTIGLLQDFGLLVLFYLHQNRISEWPQLALLGPDERYAMELQLFVTTHDKVGQLVANNWQLPDELQAAIGHHHDRPPEDAPELIQDICKLARCADWMAAVFTCENTREAIQRCREVLAEEYAIDEMQVDQLLDSVSEQIDSAATAFGIEVGEQPGFDELIHKANLHLANENLTFQEMTLHLERALDERDRKAAVLHRELELAREVQRSLLPSEKANQYGLIGVNVSAKEVSGDFYDFFTLRTGNVAFCIADVAGKGMYAAMLMAKTSSLFHCLGKGIHDPAKLLAMLNNEIAETTIHGMFVTMIAGIYDPVSQEIIMSNAGHPPAIKMHGVMLAEEYPATAPPLGIVLQTEFTNTRFKLGSNSTLYLYTDGLVEAKISATERLERDGLLKLLGKFDQKRPIERLQRIVREVRKNQSELADDITLLMIELEQKGHSLKTEHRDSLAVAKRAAK
jgi:serine phosphatase RsbU (regulator of sigma subunit)